MRKFLSVLILVAVIFPFIARPPQAQAISLENFLSLDSVANALGFVREEDQITNFQVGSVVDLTSKASLTTCAIGIVEPCEELLGIDLSNSSLPANPSAIGMLSNGIAILYNQPAADTRAYIADVTTRAGFVKPAYAQFQGIGFSGLVPMLDIWRGFRNVAYGFLILAMVVIGFMIMFRRRIDPRTVMTVQNALPRIILTLILITFSYAIVGLLIDLVYVFIGISFVAIFNASGSALGEAVQQISDASFPSVAQLGTIGIDSVDDLRRLLGGVISVDAWILQGTGVGLGALIGAIVGGGAGAIPGAILGPFALEGIGFAIPALIIMLAVLFAILRIFFLLLAAYIQVIISTIFAPILIMFNAIPGNNSFSAWIRNLVANLSVFVITAVMLTLAAELAKRISEAGTLWAPPGLSGNIGTGAAGLIGLGFSLAIPSVAAGIKESIGAKSAVRAGPSVLLAPINAATGAMQQLVYLKNTFRPPQIRPRDRGGGAGGP